MVIIICDSSILILLSKLEMLDILIESFESIVISRAVYVESVEQGKKLKKMDAFLIEKRIKDRKIVVENIKNLADKEKFIKDFNIHDGESETIILYLEKNADLLGTDDYKTLKICKILKIKYFTTPLFIIRCFLKKKLAKNVALLKFKKLLEFGWYKEENIIDFKNKMMNLEVWKTDRVISVRINKSLEEIVKRYSEETNAEQSDIIRDLINKGSLYIAIKGYSKGKYSIGKAAYLANLPLSEFMDLIMELGIKSKISKEDLLEGYDNLKELFW